MKVQEPGRWHFLGTGKQPRRCRNRRAERGVQCSSLTLQLLQQPDGARRGLPTCSWGPARQVIGQRAGEEDESSATAGKENGVKHCNATAAPPGLWAGNPPSPFGLP